MKLLLFTLIAAVALAVPVGAQPVADHLKCYKVKDPQAKATYTADLDGLTPEPGCVIKVPAKLACVPATKTNMSESFCLTSITRPAQTSADCARRLAPRSLPDVPLAS